jgi:Golgi phosphoprotein 3 GPP34
MRVRDFPSVRDRLWLLAHDESRMRPLIDVRALDIGLTGAALADLLLNERIEIKRGYLYPYGRHREDVTDPIASDILAAITAGAGLWLPEVFRSARAETTVRPWSPFQRLYTRTVAELVAAGGLTAEQRFIRSTRYQAADPYLLPSVRAQFNRRLAFLNDPADPGVDSLCALAWALNLHSGGLIMPFSSSEAETILAGVVKQIPVRAQPPSPLAMLPELADGVRHAVGDLATAPF